MNLHGMRLSSMRLLSCVAAMTLLASFANVNAAQPQPVDPTLPVYRQVQDLRGTLTLVGSTTMSDMASIWGDSFRKRYPNVQIDIQVEGAANAFPSVMEGKANFGLLSRAPSSQEVEDFYKKFGYLPTVVTPAQEAIAVFVHKDNPIESISYEALHAMFAQNPVRGSKATMKTWGEAGVGGQWANVPIVAQGRRPETGVQVYFQAMLLGGGPFRADMPVNITNLDMIHAIEADKRSIGFAGMGFETPNVKPLALGKPPVDIHTAGYPLVRPLNLVLNKNPKKPMSDVEKEFIKFVFSQTGQQDVVRVGLTPISTKVAHAALDAVEAARLE